MMPNSILILLVEDDEGFSEMLKRRLELEVSDWEIVIVGTMEAARGILESVRIHLTILDLALPDSLTPQTIQAIPQFRSHAPVIILTGKEIRDTDAFTKCFAYGAADVWEKTSLDGDGKLFFVKACNSAITRREFSQNDHHVPRV